MANFKPTYFELIFLLSFLALFLVSSCASMQQPTGGPRDTIPPKVVKESPSNLNRNFSAEKIVIEFDEFIKLSNEFSEVTVSPAIDQSPILKARKEKLEISFEDSLERNTTYTINFGKAIVDVNESNVLKNYTYVFSTGATIDSLSISGSVYNMLTQEKEKDVTVFIMPLSQDSLFGKKRSNLFTTTDTSGNFSLKNLRMDSYRIYALKETGGGDRVYNSPNEDIGFLKDPLVLDSNITGIRIGIFRESPRSFSVLDRKIESDGKLSFTFNQQLENPTLSIIDPAEFDSRKLVEFGSRRDSASLWLPEISFDSLKVVVSDNARPLDTVVLRRGKKDAYTRNVLLTSNVSNGKLRPGVPYQITTSTPIASFDAAKISLQLDSTKLSNYTIERVQGSQRRFNVLYNWRPGRKYSIRFSDGAFTDIMGGTSKTNTQQFQLDTDDSYGNLTVDISVPDSTKSYVVELLNPQKTVVKSTPIKSSQKITYSNYPTLKYRMRIVYDLNANGKWDTGNVPERRFPEKVWNYEKEFTLRPNWDLEEKIIIPPDQ